MNLPTITKDNECIYLTQDLSGMGVYDKAKAIVQFCDKETKLFEKEIDRVILEIFEKHNIIINDTKKETLKRAFEKLHCCGMTIKVEDIYKNIELYNSEKIKECKLFTIWLEENCYLQIGVSIKEERK